MEIPAEKNEVTVEVQGEATSVRGNRNLIDELIYNLCSNAVRYNKKGGKVTIITRTEDGHPTLIVKDTGMNVFTVLIKAVRNRPEAQVLDLPLSNTLWHSMRRRSHWKVRRVPVRRLR